MIALVLVVAACTGSAGPKPDATVDSAVDTSGETDSAVAFELPTCGWTGAGPYRVPDPGRVGDGYCNDTEPNDGPDAAVPCGVVDSPFSAQIYVRGRLSDTDTADWFVFVAGEKSDFNGQYSWWETGTDLLDQVLYEVTDDCTDLVEIKRWTSTSREGENLSHTDGVTIVPARIYAVSFEHVEGAGTWFT